jgi:hypothetical protein
MEPQHPPVPFSATYAHQSQQTHQSPSNAATSEYEYTYNEKDSYPQLQSNRTERGSKASSRRAHDSVISHPFSPKQSYPPSPTSSVSSAGGRRHQSIPEIQFSAPNESQSLKYPPQAHLDPEKHGYGSSPGHGSQRHSGSGRGANDAVYDQGEYHESAPEEKAWQLLVSITQTWNS